MSIQKQTDFLKNRPVATGFATVLGVFTIGVGIAFAGGFATPHQAAAFISLPPCCTLPPPPPPILPPPPIVIPPPVIIPPPVVIPPPVIVLAPVPQCVLTADNTTLQASGVTNLTWTSRNAETASLNQGIGQVALNGSRYVYVPETRTFTLTVTGIGGVAHCNVTITVTPQQPPPPPPPPPVVQPNPPVCTLVNNSNFAITWTSSNATYATIDGAPVTPVSGGSRAIAPTRTTTYTFVATGPGGTVTCTTTVVVTPPPPNAPTCVLTASPTSLPQGSAGSLIWNTSNATSVTISSFGAVALDGTRTITPSVTTTYTLTATGNGGTVNCVATVVVVPPPVQPVPACTLTISTNNITNGGSAVLYWTGTNVSSFVIDQGVGSVSPTSGSVTVFPGSSRTYTATATGQYGTVTCATSVSVNTLTPGGPTCVMSLSQYTIREGEQASLRWEGNNVSSVFINNGIGNVSQNGVQTVAPRAGTYTYQGTFYGYNGQSVTCLATLRVDTINRGTTNVTLDQLPPAEGLPLASLYLADLPYTGLDLGPVGTMLYWLALIVWSLALAYLIFWSLVPYAFKRVTIRTNTNETQGLSTLPVAPVYTDTRTSYSASTHSEPAVPATNGYESFKASIAKDGPLTIEDIVNGLSRAATDEHVLPLAPVHTAHTTEQVTTKVETFAPVQTHTRKEVVTTVHHDVPAFISALLAAQKDQVFGMIREMNKAGHNVEDFLTHVVVALDDAYRAKIDGTPVHTEVARVCEDCAPSFLERVIASLTTVVDGSYVTGVTGVKLAVTRALHAVEG